jgi:CubicO group peptidase (beta-lactamase class C family)
VGSALRQEHLLFRPGSARNYSNLGYAVLGLVAENSEQEAFPKIMQRLLFQPLGTSSTGWTRADFPEGSVATGYVRRGNGFVAKADWQLGASQAMGGVYTSALDLARIARLLLEGPTDDSARPVSRDGIRQALRLAMLSVTNDGQRGLAHGGSTSTFSAAIELAPASGVASFALANSSGSSDLAMGIRQLLRSVVTGECSAAIQRSVAEHRATVPRGAAPHQKRKGSTVSRCGRSGQPRTAPACPTCAKKSQSVATPPPAGFP